jgi:hypothetical protein
VFLSFDIEVWCNGWQQLDEKFPAAFDRYVYGRSAAGAYALPETLAMLNRHGLQGVFFVEPLFAARFGLEPLREIVGLIQGAGQQVQLHLHPEWTDEAREPLLPDVRGKRQHLSYYSLDEQTALIAHGLRLLGEAGAAPICAFRAGSYAANRDSFHALARNGIALDSSLNRCGAVSGLDLRATHRFDAPFICDGVSSYPVSVFTDGLGRERPAQVGACGAAELRSVLDRAQQLGVQDFVIVSHNFEMLRSGRSDPDWIVVRRFEALCAYLAAHPQRFQVRGFADDLRLTADGRPGATPRASLGGTLWRHGEQLRRRLQR